MWRSEVDPTVLLADAEPARVGTFDIRRFGRAATLIRGAEGEHLVISDGLRRIRIDILSGTVGRGPVHLRFRVPDGETLPALIRALDQYRGLQASGRFVLSLHPPEVRAPRWIAQLRVLDALSCGCSEREIAAVLLGADAVRSWREGSDHVRSAVRRLVRSARDMAEFGYLRILKPPRRGR